MTEIQRRAYGVGKDARTTGEDLDIALDFLVHEGALPDTHEVDQYARMGFAAAAA